MRKIDKSKILSTQYYNWQKNFEEINENHPKYSSSHKYYLDLVMNLFYCQNGLCAYTEMELCPCNFFEVFNWQEGRYINSEDPQIFGDIEHFDSNLKKAKGWLWDNLFMVHSNINTRAKGTNSVDTILKPDTEEYDEFKLLKYNADAHIYIPNTDLSEEEQERIKKMILILGINYDAVKGCRSRVLSEKIEAVKLGIKNGKKSIYVNFQLPLKCVEEFLAI